MSVVAQRKITPERVDTDTFKRVAEGQYGTWATLCKARRKQFKWTLRQAAEASDGTLTFQTLSKIERGEIAPTEATKLAVAYLYRTNVSSLFPSLTQRELLAKMRPTRAA